MNRLRKHNLVYLGTPYSKFPTGIEFAFREASALAGRLLKAGVNVYSPIAHTHPLAIYGDIDPLDHNIWLPFDATMMTLAQAMVVAKMKSWEISYGIRHEIKEFTQAGKPVYYLEPDTLVVSDKP